MFKIRDFNTITTEMISLIVSTNPGITDFTEGSVTRALVESFGKQIQRLETNVLEGITDSINVSTYQNFNFQRLPASFASGLIRFYTSPVSFPQQIPAGTLVKISNANLVYVVNQNTLIPANATFVDTLCTCQTLGSIGNTPANTITYLVSNNLSFITSVNNLNPIINGSDQEADAARATRFQNYLLSLSRGTTISLESAAQNVMILDNNGNILESVAQALVVEPFLTNPSQPVGTINIYIDNGSGTASNAIVAQVINVIAGYVDSSGMEHAGYLAAGVNFNVYAVIPFSVNVSCNLTLQPGAISSTVVTAVNTAITNYVSSLTIGQPVLFAELISAAINVIGVNNVVFSKPTSDVTVPFNAKAVTGSIIITTS